MTKEELTAAARAFDANHGCGSIGRCETCMADFAAAMLEREGVYREICEAATAIRLNHPDGPLLRRIGGGWFVLSEVTHDREVFPTLEEAYAWVKERER